MDVSETESTYDVVIVGGGVAGLSAALVLGRARRRVAVVDAGAPRNAPAAHLHGYLSRDGLPPAELLAAGRAEVVGYGVEMVEGAVAHTSRCAVDAGSSFRLELVTGDRLLARRVLVATGVADELPDVGGLRERWGRDVLHCPYCHGWEVRDQPLGIIGWLPGSVEHAHLVRQWSDDVVFFVHHVPITPAERAQLAARHVRVVDGVVSNVVVHDERLVGVELADGTFVARSAVFVRPANRPRSGGPLVDLGCDTDATGLPVVDATGRTTVDGVWAAGNVVDPRLQLIAAAGAANVAAIAVNADLVADDVGVALIGWS